jgi:hypothetical protein
MFKLIVIVSLISGTVCLAWNSTQQVAGQSKPAAIQAPQLIGCSLIEPLDESIQLRFRQVNKGFGFARVAPPSPHLPWRLLRPETDAETLIINELQKKHWQVALYLAGRPVLDPPREVNDAQGKSVPLPGWGIHNPVLITATAQALDWPKPQQFREQAQQAFTAFERADRYDFSLGRFSFSARPIRAEASCLKCHNDQKLPVMDNGAVRLSDLANYAYSPTPPKVGDALGAAIYAYRQTKL